MLFKEKQTLSTRGPVDPGPDEETSTYLIGESPLARWEDNHSQYGCDCCSLYPIWQDGERRFLLRKSWAPEENYTASGDEEEIITFEEGVKLLCEKGCWDVFIRSNK